MTGNHPAPPSQRVTRQDIENIVMTRVTQPERVAELYASRAVPSKTSGRSGRIMLIAADHPARGSLGAGTNAFAMGDRTELLDRMVRALERPGVDGVLGTPDIVEDLLLLGALEDKIIIGSMNRGGVAGTVFEIDDRFTGYNAASIDAAGLQGGKMLMRIDPNDSSTVATMEACARAVSELAARRSMALVEPFMSGRDDDGRVRNVLTAESVVRSATIAAGLGHTSAYTWLKLPVVENMDAVLSATTLPVLLLGGEVAADQSEQMDSWARALSNTAVRGLVIGRSLLFPPDHDVETAVDAAVGLL